MALKTNHATGKEKSLPEITSIGMCKMPAGWVIVKLVSQGLTILDQDVLSTPEPWADASLRLEAKVIEHLVLEETND
jgi:hypothetical protein